MSTLERTIQRNKNIKREGETMQKITWTATDDGNMHIATNEGGFQIGHVRIKLAKSDLPVLAVIANWTTKSFALVQHAKDWVEEQYNYVEDAIENA